MVESPRTRKSSVNSFHGLSGQYQSVAATEHRDDRDISPGADIEMDDLGSDDDITVYGQEDEQTRLTLTSDGARRRGSQGRSGSTSQEGSTNGGMGTTQAGLGGNDRLDQASEKKKLVTATLFKETVTNALLIGLWYSFSICISVYNKWMFSKDNLNFAFPLFTSSMHMVVQFIFASAVLYFFPRFRPGAAPDLETPAYTQLNASADDAPAEPGSKPPPTRSQPLMTRAFYFTRIAPCGTATALDIGLGNFSLRFISLTFFTMCKSSTLAFVLLFAFLFALERPTWRLCAIIFVMSVGVVMMVAGEAAFDAAGFALVMTACLCSGFRWSLTQILLLRNRATGNPFSAAFFLTPVMFLALFLLALPVEGPRRVIDGISALAAQEGAALSLLILLFPGALAFLMVSAEFALLKRTSVVTLSVCGIFKEVLTISAAGAIFGDALTPINVSGLVVTIASIAAYNALKYTKMRREAAKEVQEILDAGAADADEPLPTRLSLGRASTDALMRQSLTGRRNGEAAGLERKSRDVSHSPDKRPEDLE